MIQLPEQAPMREYQRYIHALEELHGWLDVDLVHNCFLMGEEVGELFKAVRRYQRYFDPAEASAAPPARPDTRPDPADDPADGLGGDDTVPVSPAGAPEASEAEARRAEVAEELVDVFNYLVALANRLDINLEAAFRAKNARNQTRSWT